MASMNSKRSGLGVCVLGTGRLYAVGGWDGSNRLLSVERYDEGKNQWELVGNMSSVRSVLGVAVIPPMSSASSSSSSSSSSSLSHEGASLSLDDV